LRLPRLPHFLRGRQAWVAIFRAKRRQHQNLLARPEVGGSVIRFLPIRHGFPEHRNRLR
jgi:hypothetical protein